MVQFMWNSLHELLFVFVDGFIGNMKRKRANVKDVRDRNILGLYNKLHELVGLIADLLSIQTLTDTTVLLLSSLGVAPFFVENVPELQLSSLRLVTKVGWRTLTPPKNVSDWIDFRSTVQTFLFFFNKRLVRKSWHKISV